MFRSLTIMLVLTFATTLSFASDPKTSKGVVSVAAAGLNGKEVFLKHKCNNCHAVSTAGIEAKTKSKAPDLVDVTVRHEKPWIRRFIRQNDVHVSCPKVDPLRDGKKHAIKFKGTQDEEDALIEWLDQQRSGK
ncbi:MAG: c-type cytochrome [Candidatus Yanofskybacteria bacterium]|nr:c-type cytochrome [Candidatus Yanofskybacteria bacterium]